MLLRRCHILPWQKVISRSIWPRPLHPATPTPRVFSTDKPPKIDRPASMGGSRGQPDHARNRTPISWVHMATAGIAMATVYGWYTYAKNKKEAAIERERKREVGKAKIGGTFELVDHTGKKRSSEDFLGQWVLLYFGFTHCPDICPDEMEKLAEVIDKLSNHYKGAKEFLPLFITVDPERDGVQEVAEYIKEFHPRMVGLTGTVDQIKEACKAYRVYFSAGPRDEEDDYIVDHTIIIYLIDPDGQFVDYYGQTKTANAMYDSILLRIGKHDMSQKKSFLDWSKK